MQLRLHSKFKIRANNTIQTLGDGKKGCHVLTKNIRENCNMLQKSLVNSLEKVAHEDKKSLEKV